MSQDGSAVHAALFSISGPSARIAFRMIEITSSQRAFLRSVAQTVDPVVMVGREGGSAAVAAALDEALSCHELVKVRFQSHKDEVLAISRQLAASTGSLLVSTTGFTSVFYRESSDADRRRFDLERKVVVDK